MCIRDRDISFNNGAPAALRNWGALTVANTMTLHSGATLYNKGTITKMCIRDREEACPEEIVPSYAVAGASALSILTDEKFFGGSLKDIRTARPLVDSF